ncbi:SDR family oxidoreductase [Rubrivirga sp. S365]|uniref:SDR family oxidoreductase n=1 Tax=Rubrivirga litoralis TaxID=3075598 RepID=A0ABU3BS18_9BACT|nr:MULTISPECIES: SDR family oxidoreductase [unclassified Rubrivirga]MDT0632082.1 SDR family oxidoreductase [Rubrivirga sp. F394]MDT7856160.1 SDR family oxidoreductase [Rubrivirga sp. S365]
MPPRPHGPAVTLITGAANGIARQFARDLLAEGDRRLVLCDLDLDGLEAAFGDTPAQLRRLDVSSLAAWRDVVGGVVEEHGRIDAVCNIAGVLTPGWIWEIDDRQIDLQVDVNVKGVLYGSKVAAEQMVSQGWGHIVNMASLAGIAYTPGNAIYGATKHAVRGFSVSIACELRERGVAVSTVCPGVVDTQMLDDQIDRDEAAVTFLTGTPLTTGQVSTLLQDVLRDRPVEACLPNAASAKLMNAAPGLAVRAYRVIAARGQRAAAHLRARRA